MKKAFTVVQLFAVLCMMHSTLFAAELLDVKPVVAGASVSIEITADIAMTYTYYKIPGQARAVVDIAEADPEKVEPLIVVNKGMVSSISVDKAQFSGIVVSRIIFNLVSEADISVSASPDRKLLTVTFGGATAAASKPEPEIKPLTAPEPVLKVESPAAIAASASAPSTGAPKEEDPLGLDEPEAAPIMPTAKTSTVKTDSGIELSAATPKLEPVVPVATAPARSSSLTINEIVTGARFVEIRANLAISEYKVLRLTSPDRLVIDIATDNTSQKPTTAAINKFGISKIRVGVSPTNIRVVMDSSKAGFPAHTITKTESGLRINFK